MPSREARRRRAFDAWHTCGRKRAFRRRGAADEAARRITAQGRDHMIAYECPHCGRWHLSHYEKHHPPGNTRR